MYPAEEHGVIAMEWQVKRHLILSRLEKKNSESKTKKKQVPVNTNIYHLNIPHQWSQWHQTKSAGPPNSSEPLFLYIPVSPVHIKFNIWNELHS